MIVQINTDKSIEGAERHIEYFTQLITDELSRFASHITRVEVHLKDENGPKEGVNDMRCVLEARLRNRQPMVVTNQADTIELALKGAIDKSKTSINKVVGKLQNH